MVTLKNGTPHGVTVLNLDGSVQLEIPASGFVFGCVEAPEPCGNMDTDHGVVPLTQPRRTLAFGLPGRKQRIATPLPLPAEEDGTYWIVSTYTAAAVARKDFLVPGTLRVVDGKIIGAYGLRFP